MTKFDYAISNLGSIDLLNYVDKIKTALGHLSKGHCVTLIGELLHVSWTVERVGSWKVTSMLRNASTKQTMPSSPVHSEDENKFQLKILQFKSKV